MENNKKEVLLDTNFLMVPYQFKLDVFRELDYLLEPPYLLLVPSAVVSELKKLSKKVGKQGLGARFALKLVSVGVSLKRLSIVPSEGHVDDWISKYAKEKRAIVCTNDRGLKERLLRDNIRVIVLKSKSKLGVV